MNTTRILDKAKSGERLTLEEGVALFDCHDLNALGRAANAVTLRLHPEPYRTYNIDRNVNYTNVCAAVCDFCAFYRKSSDADAYVLPREELYKKIEEAIALGGDQILMQGGMHPSLKLEWYEELLRDLRSRFPAVNLHAFSPPEIWHFHKLNKLPLREVLKRLKDAGLGSLPGGGGVRVPPHPGHRPALPRQRPEHPVLVGDAGGEDRPGRAVLRGQRHGQPDDRGERRRLGRHGALPHARRDQALHPRGRLGTPPAQRILPVDRRAAVPPETSQS